jgi:L-2,4-diaminobutyric acid acetyltransferase
LIVTFFEDRFRANYFDINVISVSEIGKNGQKSGLLCRTDWHFYLDINIIHLEFRVEEWKSRMHRSELRRPRLTDGVAVHRLILRCSPVDEESRYCNLLRCTHFADTCVVAERDGEIVGFVSAYVEPSQPDTLFVWRVVVAPEHRGQGLTAAMLGALLARETCRDITHLETSITPKNQTSWRSFHSAARQWGAKVFAQPWLDRERDFEGERESEFLLRIGPIARQPNSHVAAACR